MAFFGVILVVFNGSITLKVQPVGDLLALLAAASWAVYGILLRRWSSLYDGVLITKAYVLWSADNAAIGCCLWAAY